MHNLKKEDLFSLCSFWQIKRFTFCTSIRFLKTNHLKAHENEKIELIIK